MRDKIALFWFRRDLQPGNNAGLYHAPAFQACRSCRYLFSVPIRMILGELEDRSDRRVDFTSPWAFCGKNGNYGIPPLDCRIGKPGPGFYPGPVERLQVGAVYTNHDYEPYARERDAAIGGCCKTGNRFPYFSRIRWF